MQNRLITIRELVDQVGINIGSVHTIVTEDLAMRRVSAKFVPKLLTMEQKKLRVKVSQDMLDCSNGNPDFLNIMISSDESWLSGGLFSIEGFLEMCARLPYVKFGPVRFCHLIYSLMALGWLTFAQALLGVYTCPKGEYEYYCREDDVDCLVKVLEDGD